VVLTLLISSHSLSVLLDSNAISSYQASDCPLSHSHLPATHAVANLQVDDLLFIHILLEHLAKHNEQRKIRSNNIQAHGGPHIDSGRKWYRGTSLLNDQPEEYDEVQSRTHRNGIRLSKLPVHVNAGITVHPDPILINGHVLPTLSIYYGNAASNKPVVQHLQSSTILLSRLSEWKR